MKLNFNVPIVDVDGKVLREAKTGGGEGEPLMLGKVLATNLKQFIDPSVNDPFKLMETWAMPMYAGKDIEFDSSDLELFKGVIKNPKLGLFPITQYAALKLIRDAELKQQTDKKSTNN
jgi:hypothetical protein